MLKMIGLVDKGRNTWTAFNVLRRLLSKLLMKNSVSRVVRSTIVLLIISAIEPNLPFIFEPITHGFLIIDVAVCPISKRWGRTGLEVIFMFEQEKLWRSTRNGSSTTAEKEESSRGEGANKNRETVYQGTRSKGSCTHRKAGVETNFDIFPFSNRARSRRVSH